MGAIRNRSMRCHARSPRPHPGESLRMRFCRNQSCLALFFLCPQCDHGNVYCTTTCREQNREKHVREARLRYEETSRALELHRERQRRYRIRLKQRRVTDHPSSISAIEKTQLDRRGSLTGRLSGRSIYPKGGSRHVVPKLKVVCVVCGFQTPWIALELW